MVVGVVTVGGCGHVIGVVIVVFMGVVCCYRDWFRPVLIG